MNIRQLKMFKLFVETKSVNTVAELMQITQPTVSFHLKNLQEQYKAELYRKKGNHFTLTSAGEMLYLSAVQMVSLAEETERMLEEYGAHKRGRLVIGASNTPLNEYLPNVFKHFITAYPNIKLSVIVDTAPNIVEKVKEREIDLGVVSEVGILSDSLQIKRIIENPLVVVMDKNHPLAALQTICASDIKQYDFIIHQSGSTRTSIDAYRANHLIDLKIAMEINSIQSILSMVQETKFLGILSQSSIPNHKQVIYKPLVDAPKDRYISLIYKKDKAINTMMQNFISLMYQEKKKA